MVKNKKNLIKNLNKLAKQGRKRAEKLNITEEDIFKMINKIRTKN